MNKIYLAKNAHPQLIDYLRKKHIALHFISTTGLVDPAISQHPDIFLCKLGITPEAPVIFAEPTDLGPVYPQDIPFNAACTGKFFLHHTAYTHPRLLAAAKSMNMEIIHVRQGYTKCNTAIIDENAIITSDAGIIKACSAFPALDVLPITPGHIVLDGYDTGFIGGCCGRIGNELIFNGNLAAHPDFLAIKDFITSRGLSVHWFPDYPLTDIGSIL